MSNEFDDVINALTDYDAAQRASNELASPALELAEELAWEEALEVFRRVAANEITAGSFLTRFAAAVAAADLENRVVMLPTVYKLLVKYPALLEQHRARPAITEFPPSE